MESYKATRHLYPFCWEEFVGFSSLLLRLILALGVFFALRASSAADTPPPHLPLASTSTLSLSPLPIKWAER